MLCFHNHAHTLIVGGRVQLKTNPNICTVLITCSVLPHSCSYSYFLALRQKKGWYYSRHFPDAEAQLRDDKWCLSGVTGRVSSVSEARVVLFPLPCSHLSCLVQWPSGPFPAPPPSMPGWSIMQWYPGRENLWGEYGKRASPGRDDVGVGCGEEGNKHSPSVCIISLYIQLS